MLDVEISVRNYRCIGDEPVRIRVADGFTALIGINNSGKSSLLKMPYEMRNLFRFLANGPVNEVLKQALTGGTLTVNQWGGGLAIASGERIFRTGSTKPIELEFTVHDSPSGQFMLGYNPGTFSLTLNRQNELTTVLKDGRGKILSAYDGTVEGIQINAEPLVEVMKIMAGALYIGPFRNAINVGGQGQYYDIQTGDSFIRTFAHYKSGPQPEHNEAVAQLMEDIKRIFGFRTLDINPAEEYQVLQLTVDGRSYRLAEQGAGLAHFIVVLANLLVRRPSLLLIDEPELNLHASLQLDFLETLASYTECGMVFATHSLGLARTAADRIYCFSKPVGGTTTVRPYEADRELVTLLGQLSFDHRPDLGFSKVLLVEGKTELRALLPLLRLFHKEHEILMLSLHGDEMIRGDVEEELIDVLRVGGDVHYLIDSERDAENAPLKKDRQDFVNLCAKLGIDGLVLQRRALENYFTEETIRRALGRNTKVLEPYEKKGEQHNWSKANNWRVTAAMSLDDLNGTDLGNFLEQL